MFRQRLLTSLILVPLVLFAIYYANIWVLRGMVLFLAAIGAWEWTQLIPIKQLTNKIVFLLLLLFTTGISGYYFDAWLYVGLLVWVGILFAVLSFPASQPIWGHRLIVAGLCLLLLPLFTNTLVGVYQHMQGKSLIVYLLCLVWATDIGAYLVGKSWGRYKLIPKVSPGKTVEGCLGGFILAMLVAIIGYIYFKPNSSAIWYGVAVVTTFISTLGDLSISMLKRRSKLKDTGSIFPGHGGVLDRLDSLIAATPVFFYGLSFLANPF